MLTRDVKDRLHEKMGNLTFMYSRKLLIISSITESPTCRLFKKAWREPLFDRIMQVRCNNAYVSCIFIWMVDG